MIATRLKLPLLTFASLFLSLAAAITGERPIAHILHFIAIGSCDPCRIWMTVTMCRRSSIA